MFTAYSRPGHPKLRKTASLQPPPSHAVSFFTMANALSGQSQRPKVQQSPGKEVYPSLGKTVFFGGVQRQGHNGRGSFGGLSFLIKCIGVTWYNKII